MVELAVISGVSGDSSGIAKSSYWSVNERTKPTRRIAKITIPINKCITEIHAIGIDNASNAPRTI
jgi:hypothetical protein